MTSLAILTLALALPAADDPKAVIEKAIKAHGGAELLDKFVGHRSSIKGTITASGMEIPIAGTFLRAYPDKEKVKASLNVGGMDLELLQVANGDKISLTVGGQAPPLDDDRKAEARFSTYSNGLARLTPLVKAGSKFTLKAGPEAAVGGSPAVGVVVEHPDFKPVTLFFGKETGRLVKATRTSLSEDGQTAERETTFGDYKAVQGVQMAFKSSTTVGGKKISDFTADKIEMLETVDASEFAVD